MAGNWPARRRSVGLNKIDALTDEDIAERKAELEAACGQKVMLLSGVSGSGVRNVLAGLWHKIAEGKAEEAREDEADEEYRP